MTRTDLWAALDTIVQATLIGVAIWFLIHL
jgi:hypothetical protein